jgi:hypothetical protein
LTARVAELARRIKRLIHICDVLTESEWRDIEVRTPGLFEIVKRKPTKRNRSGYYTRFLPVSEEQKAAHESRAMHAMLSKIGYRRFFAVFDRS